MAEATKPSVELHENVVSQTEAGDIDDAINLADAVATAKYSPWAPGVFRLYGVLLTAYLSACLNGYDGSLMGGLNAMKSYQEYFHM
jgi:hypothetical protein